MSAPGRSSESPVSAATGRTSSWNASSACANPSRARSGWWVATSPASAWKRGAGVAMLLVSAELDEVLDLSDRILVMYRGRIVGTFAAAEAQREKVGLLMATGEARG